MPASPSAQGTWITAVTLCAWLLLVAPGRVSAEPPTDHEGLDAIVSEVENLVLEAHFHTAVGVARTARTWVDAASAGPELRARRARLQVLVATAHVALGNEQEAKESLRRALALDPYLALDSATTSPKLLRLLNDLLPPQTERASR
jgi:hypothetical protein